MLTRTHQKNPIMIFLPHFLAFSKLKFSLLAKQKKTGRGSMESGDTCKIPMFELHMKVETQYR